MMTEHPTEKELDVQNEDRQQSESEQAGTALVEFDAGRFFHPSASGKDCDRYRNTKECLSDGSMCGGYQRWLKHQHRKSAEHRLHDHRAERTNCQPPQPAPLLDEECPERNGQG